MADILKITTPLVNKSQALDPKKNVELNTQFDLRDISKVLKPSEQEQILSQNNGMNQQEETSALLLNLLKNPSVTMGFLKNIFMLEEMIKLLPVNNQTFTKEIQQIFDQLLLNPEDLVEEMVRQEKTSTIFKGNLFDFLRELLQQSPGQKDLQHAVVNFLKALNGYASRTTVLNSVANNLQFLSESLNSSKGLSERLLMLSERFRAEDAEESFPFLKDLALNLLRETENSILYTPKLAKVLSITIYNLSRFNDNPSFFQEATGHVLSQLRGEEARETFLKYVEEFFASGGRLGGKGDSSVVDVLARLIGKQASSEELMLVNADKMEKVVRSLLSSPCNFTPLFHFVLPVQQDAIRSFAEVWINPNGEEDDRSEQDGEERKKSIHMLLVFDIGDIGRFEMELYVRDKVIDFSLFCPPGYAKEYQEASENMSQCLQGLDYHFGEMRIDELERPRSLMDVFRSLPYKRTGVDVRI